MHRNWSAIASGATFEALVGSLIAHEDSAARIFSRAGPDAGQDALSGDGRTVYQAKYFRDAKAAKALKAARDEADKIAGYRKQGHAHESKWRDVEHWVLVTNTPFNSNDLIRWNKEIVPRFEALGLTIACWSEGEVNAKLDQHPEIHRAFFEGETRLFLSLSEIRDSRIVESGKQVVFVGRTEELSEFDAFMSGDKRILLVHGQAGVGKSRFLFEAASKAVDRCQVSEVLWGNLENLSVASAWYNAIVPERKLLIILDEPRDDRVLRRVLEELRTSQRVAQWKLVVGVRTPNDLVVNSFRSAAKRLTAAELVLNHLQLKERHELARQILLNRVTGLSEEDAPKGAKIIARVTEGYPLWIEVAVRLVADGKPLAELPQDPAGILDAYISEIVSNGQATSEIVKRTLLWVALLDPLNVEDGEAIELVADHVGVSTPKLHELLIQLASRRALTRRGANSRLYELLPRALCDAFLLAELSYIDSETSKRAPTELGEQLVGILAAGFHEDPIPGLNTLLRRIGSLELVAQGNLNLLDSVAEAATTAAKASNGASYRKRILETVTEIGRFRPLCIVEVSKYYRANPSASEQTSTPIGYIEDTHEDILLSLAWPVYLAGMLAVAEEDKVAILRELLSIAEAVDDCGRPLPNDGRRAGALVTRLIHSEQELVSDYTAAGALLARERVKQIADSEELTKSLLCASEGLINAMLAIKRLDRWFEEDSFSWRHLQLNPDGPASVARSAIRESLWEIVSSSKTAARNRIAAWGLLDRAHAEANQARKHELWRKEVENDLDRTLEFLSFEWPTSAEIHKARKIWDWHLEFGDDPKLKACAAKNEAAYLAHASLGDWAWLGSFRRDKDEMTDRSNKLFAELSQFAEPDDLAQSFEDAANAIGLLPDDRQWRRHLVDGVFYRLGWQQGLNGPAASVARRIAQCDSKDTRFRLYSSVLRGAFAHARANDINTARFMEHLVSSAEGGLRGLIIDELYLTADAHDSATFTWDEFDFISRELGESLDVGRPRTWELIGHFFGMSGELVLDVVVRRFPSIPLSQAQDSFLCLVDSLSHRLSVKDSEMTAFGLFEWCRLLSLLLYVPDLDHLGGTAEWTLNDINEKLGQPTFSWGIDLLDKRRQRGESIQQPAAMSAQRYHALPYGRGFYGLFSVCDPDSDRGAIERVLSWFGQDDMTDYWLPQCLTRLDGEGAIVPLMVAEHLADAAQKQDSKLFLSLAKIAGYYVEGSSQWMPIAEKACRHATNIGDDPIDVYAQLSWKGIESWSGAAGEIHPRWQSQLNQTEAHLSESTNTPLEPYWAWRVDVARERLQSARDRHDEEYGR